MPKRRLVWHFGWSSVDQAISSVCCAAVALPTRGAVGAAFMALGAAMPGLLVLDMARYLGFAAGNAARAAVLDIVWLVVQVGVTVALIRAGTDTLMSPMLA